METRRMVAMETELLKTPATRRSILKRWKFKTQRIGRRKKDYFRISKKWIVLISLP
ncbi:hypothetical protein LINGRAHAP2_LOCUS15278 [Linum grandiflorum]